MLVAVGDGTEVDLVEDVDRDAGIATVNLAAAYQRDLPEVSPISRSST